MRIEVGEKSEIIVKEVYNGITLLSNAGEKLSISMRDTGFEIIYDNKKYDAKKGIIEKTGCDNFCGMNYCDDNGCLERKRSNVEPSDDSSCVAGS
jgi:hypothetical protein